MSKRPNFLYFMTDQHRADWLGCTGHPVVRTPNIDAIAARGTVFDRFYVGTPVCMPNRASFMTGRYPSVHGLRYNGCYLSQRANTFVDVLKAVGYRTASIGKSHLQPFTDQEPMARDPVRTGPIPEAWKPEDADFTAEEPVHYDADGRFHFPTPYYGYDHVDVVTGHGDRAGGHYQQWFRAQAGNWRELLDPANQLPHNYTCPQAFRTPIPEDLYPTAYVRDRASDYIRERAADDAPFFAFVSFPDPHHPFNPPGRYWDMYSPDAFDIAIRHTDHRNPPPPLLNAIDAHRRGVVHKVKQLSFLADDQHVREAMALTAGMITMIDDAVGAVVETLRETGQDDNTIIVFNSDHGDYLGDFNLLLKGAWAKEGINRVPMIWSDPAGHAVDRTNALCSTIDIAPSILERAGVDPYFGIQGRSFLPELRGEDRQRDGLLIEYNDGGRRMGFNPPARVRTLMAGAWKLSLYKDCDWGELYNLEKDPGELDNLWDDPRYAAIRGDLTLQLAHHLIGQMDESPRSKRLA